MPQKLNTSVLLAGDELFLSYLANIMENTTDFYHFKRNVVLTKINKVRVWSGARTTTPIFLST